jgi:hypothetical protein
MMELDKILILETISRLRSLFESNTESTYSPELALKCLRPVTELLQTFEVAGGFSPCPRISTLQSITSMVLDLACESVPEGLLITNGDRQHLAEAKRVQIRVLELSATVEPSKRAIACRYALLHGLSQWPKFLGDVVKTKMGMSNLRRHHALQVL